MAVFCSDCADFVETYAANYCFDGYMSENGQCKLCRGLISDECVSAVASRIYSCIDGIDFQKFDATISLPADYPSIEFDEMRIQKFKLLIREKHLHAFNNSYERKKRLVPPPLGEVVAAISYLDRPTTKTGFERLESTNFWFNIDVVPKLHYFAGSYIKLGRRTPQSKWMVESDFPPDLSVQEILESRIREIPQYKESTLVFSASGREDVDVRCLGGRPFIASIKDAVGKPSESSLRNCLEKSSHLSPVLFKDIMVVGKEYGDKIRQGEIQKRKLYICVIWCSVKMAEERFRDLEQDCLNNPLLISQRTPIRVLHRRTNMIRDRRVFHISFELLDSGCHFSKLELETDAGTYIKEFVNGDYGRTQPNLGTLLGGKSKILQLDVKEVRLI